jgi:hypothetical protein
VLIFNTTCNKRSDPLITAVEEQAIPHAVKIFPNPTADVLQVESGMEVTGMSILDMAGRELKLEPESIHQGLYRVSLSSVPSGLYILKTVTREKVDVQKVIVRK